MLPVTDAILPHELPWTNADLRLGKVARLTPVLFLPILLHLSDGVDRVAHLHRREHLVMSPEIEQSGCSQENAHDRYRDQHEPNGETNARNSHLACLREPVALDHRLSPLGGVTACRTRLFPA
jgi:hypothetical protein